MWWWRDKGTLKRTMRCVGQMVNISYPSAVATGGKLNSKLMPLVNSQFSSHLPVWPCMLIEIDIWCTSILATLWSAFWTFPQWRNGAEDYSNVLQNLILCSFVFLVVFSGDGATCEWVRLSAENAGPRDGQSCHGWQDGLHTEYTGLAAAVRYRNVSDESALVWGLCIREASCLLATMLKAKAVT